MHLTAIPRGEAAQKLASATSKQGLNREVWAALLRVKTMPECSWRTPDTQKGIPLSLKGGRRKDKKRGKRVRDGDLSQGGSHEGGEVFKHQKTLSPMGLWGVLESQRTT